MAACFLATGASDRQFVRYQRGICPPRNKSAGEHSSPSADLDPHPARSYFLARASPLLLWALVECSCAFEEWP
jgi:hypothetical protein